MQLELEHFLTLHLRSRKFPSTAAYMETVRVLGRLVDQMRSGSAPPTSLKVGIPECGYRGLLGVVHHSRPQHR